MVRNFDTKNPSMIVIITGGFVAERLSSVSSAEAKFLCYIFEDDRDVEVVVTRWLIMKSQTFISNE
jgi:hypothetical protein